MTESNWENKRALRLELLKVSDHIQALSIVFRDKGIKAEHAVELNSLQIKIGELIGKLMLEK